MDATRRHGNYKPSPHPIPDRAAQRALTRYTVDGETGCHISTYSCGSHGYAQVGWQVTPGEIRVRSTTTAHRAAWTAIHGTIPAGMTIDHLCKNRRCVNVDHLRMLTNYENARRTHGRDWPLGQCVNGHSNKHLGYFDGGKKLHCSICHQSWGSRKK